MVHNLSVQDENNSDVLWNMSYLARKDLQLYVTARNGRTHTAQLGEMELEGGPRLWAMYHNGMVYLVSVWMAMGARATYIVLC